MEKFCMCCGRELSHDEIALHKRLYNRAATKFLCISCSSQYLQVSEELLAEKITEFKKMGCILFENKQ